MAKETNVVIEFLDELDPSLMVEETRGSKGKWVDEFMKFMSTEAAANAVLTFANQAEKRNCVAALKKFKNKYNYDLSYGNYSPGIRLWISKPNQ